MNSKSRKDFAASQTFTYEQFTLPKQRCRKVEVRAETCSPLQKNVDDLSIKQMMI